MLAAAPNSNKPYAIQKLQEMGLNQIAEWIKVLPEEKWEAMFLSRWPTLAKKCGIQEEELLLHIH